jgi:hypothetical protein
MISQDVDVGLYISGVKLSSLAISYDELFDQLFDRITIGNE